MKKYHHCIKFTYPLSFQTRIPKVDQHTGGKWLIHGTKHRKDNQLQSLEISSLRLCPELETMALHSRRHQDIGYFRGIVNGCETFK